MLAFMVLAFIGMGEALLIIVILLLFFGATRIPVIARNFGKGIREFKDATKEKEEKDKPTPNSK
ncbi:MAG: Twin-arginine translocase TatA/TatE family subunit [Adhaeribacter sp.]|jgi:sec-independent protein translocase protein TatA|nr:Twin-arginine translocase TatA/TatE family subunit [Adhaeribacter sp.]